MGSREKFVGQSKSMFIVCMWVGERLEADLQVREVLRGKESKQGSFIFLPVQPGRVRSDTVPHLFSCSTSPPSFRPSSLIIISLTSVPHHTYPQRAQRDNPVSLTSGGRQSLHNLYTSCLFLGLQCRRSGACTPFHSTCSKTHFFWVGRRVRCRGVFRHPLWQPVCHRHVTHSHAGGYIHLDIVILDNVVIATFVCKSFQRTLPPKISIIRHGLRNPACLSL